MTTKKKTTARDCSKNPCDLCKARADSADRTTCGCKRVGILVMNGTEIQRCDDCNLFETDDDAAAAVDALLKLLHRVYVRGGVDDDIPPEGRTVADAMDYLEMLVTNDENVTKGGLTETQKQFLRWRDGGRR